MRQHILYGLLIIAIMACSAADTFINIKHPIVSCIELNPIAAMLLEYTNNSLAVFIAVKQFTTCIVAAILVLIYFWRREMAMIVTSALAIFQFCTLFFMMVG